MKNLLSQYLPLPEELTPSHLESTRGKLSSWLEQAAPEVDSSPGSVFGDLLVSPASMMFAAQELGVDRLASDLLLKNPAKGLIYNCDLLQAYLSNFTDGASVSRSFGVVRLVSSEDTLVELDRGIYFSSPTGASFQPYLLNPGDIRILPVGSDKVPGQNDFTWFQTSANRFFVDIWIYGEPSSSVEEGATFATAGNISPINSVTALHTFYTPETIGSVPSHVERAKKSYLAVSWNTRASAERSVQYYFPELSFVSASIPGDVEMVRSLTNPFGLPTPTLDLYCKSSLYGSTFKEAFRADYDEATDSFSAEIHLAHIPLLIGDVSYPNSPLLITSESYGIPTDSTTPLLSAAFGKNNRFWVSFAMPRDPQTNLALLPTATDSAGDRYQNMQISYLADPVFDAVSEFLLHPENYPIGVSVYPRMPYPIVIDDLRVGYKKERATIFSRVEAAADVGTLMGTFTPDRPYSDFAVGQVIHGYGARTLSFVHSQANLHVYPAQRLLSEIPAAQNRDNLLANSEVIDSFPIGSSQFFYDERNDQLLPEVDRKLFSAGPLNIAFVVNQVTFREQ